MQRFTVRTFYPGFVKPGAIRIQHLRRCAAPAGIGV